MKRPTGVALISLLYFLGTLALLLCAALFMVGMGLAGGAGGMRVHAEGPLALLAGLGAVASVICLVFAVLFAAVGWGLWSLKEWARMVALILSGLGLAGGLLGLLGSLLFRSALFPLLGMAAVVAALVRIALNALILWYLLLPRVKQAFAAPAASGAGI